MQLILSNLSASEDQVVQKVFEARPVFVPTLVEDPDSGHSGRVRNPYT